jgi:hypothetical protein
VFGENACSCGVAPDVETIVGAYKERFDQQSVLHAEQPVCVGF